MSRRIFESEKLTSYESRFSSPFKRDKNWEIDVPHDNSCLYWSVVLAYFLPVVDDKESFQARFIKLFGLESLNQLEDILLLLKEYNPFIDMHHFFNNSHLETLVKEVFRKRVAEYIAINIEKFESFIGREDRNLFLAKIHDTLSWGGNLEIQAISFLLNCDLNVYSEEFDNTHTVLSGMQTEVTLDLAHVSADQSVSKSGNHYHFLLNDKLGDLLKDEAAYRKNGNPGVERELVEYALISVIGKVFLNQNLIGNEFRLLHRHENFIPNLIAEYYQDHSCESFYKTLKNQFSDSFLRVFGVVKHLQNESARGALKIVALYYLTIDAIKRFPIRNSFLDRRHVERNFDSEVFRDTVIFVSNSELDGFREGDGDLMDKLVYSLNHTYKIQAVRVIRDSTNVPNDKLDLFKREELHTLSPMQQKIEDVKLLQRNFLELLDSSNFSDKKIILYIGSRINVKNDRETVLGESGSLFDFEFLKQLKDRKVKIVTCCLEFKFFKRSLKQLQRAYEMLKQQLFISDKIHFLTQPDKDDFELTMNQLQIDPVLRPLNKSEYRLICKPPKFKTV